MAKKELDSAQKCGYTGYLVLLIGILYVLHDMSMTFVSWMPDIQPATVLLVLLGLKMIFHAKAQ